VDSCHAKDEKPPDLRLLPLRLTILPPESQRVSTVG
jgi:hypothetical protein